MPSDVLIMNACRESLVLAKDCGEATRSSCGQVKRWWACAEDEGDGDDLASLAQGLSRECRIVLVSGFESFNVDLYRKVCKRTLFDGLPACMLTDCLRLTVAAHSLWYHLRVPLNAVEGAFAELRRQLGPLH